MVYELREVLVLLSRVTALFEDNAAAAIVTRRHVLAPLIESQRTQNVELCDCTGIFLPKRCHIRDVETVFRNTEIRCLGFLDDWWGQGRRCCRLLEDDAAGRAFCLVRNWTQKLSQSACGLRGLRWVNHRRKLSGGREGSGGHVAKDHVGGMLYAVGPLRGFLVRDLVTQPNVKSGNHLYSFRRLVFT